MPRDGNAQLKQLAGICRRLDAARDRSARLEADRDAMVTALRAQGVPVSLLAAVTGLSRGRVTQIHNGRTRASGDA